MIYIQCEREEVWSVTHVYPYVTYLWHQLSKSEMTESFSLSLRRGESLRDFYRTLNLILLRIRSLRVRFLQSDVLRPSSTIDYFSTSPHRILYKKLRLLTSIHIQLRSVEKEEESSLKEDIEAYSGELTKTITRDQDEERARTYGRNNMMTRSETCDVWSIREKVDRDFSQCPSVQLMKLRRIDRRTNSIDSVSAVVTQMTLMKKESNKKESNLIKETILSRSWMIDNWSVYGHYDVGKQFIDLYWRLRRSWYVRRR